MCLLDAGSSKMVAKYFSRSITFSHIDSALLKSPLSKAGCDARACQSVADLLNRMGGSIENEVVNFSMTGVVRNVVQRLITCCVWVNHIAQLI